MKNKHETFQVVYVLASSVAEIEERAEILALEQSVEVPKAAIRDPDILEHVVPRIVEIKQSDADLFQVKIAYNEQTTGLDVAQFLNVLFGNSSLQNDVRLVDIDLSPGLRTLFGGPRFGLAGLRKITGAVDRPMTATAIKPMGLSASKMAELASSFALAGVDIIKDDHGLANQSWAEFRQRVELCQNAVSEANAKTGFKTIYAPNLIGTPQDLYRQCDFLHEKKIGAALMAPMLVGMPVFYEIVRDRLQVPVLAHPAFSGILGISPEFFYGKLFRMFGADISIFPNYGGRFSFSKASCLQLAKNALSDWHSLLKTLPSPAGGMQIDRIEEMVGVYGKDVVLLIGGSLLLHDDVLQKSREFVQKAREAGARN